MLCYSFVIPNAKFTKRSDGCTVYKQKYCYKTSMGMFVDCHSQYSIERLQCKQMKTVNKDNVVIIQLLC